MRFLLRAPPQQAFSERLRHFMDVDAQWLLGGSRPLLLAAHATSPRRVLGCVFVERRPVPATLPVDASPASSRVLGPDGGEPSRDKVRGCRREPRPFCSGSWGQPPPSRTPCLRKQSRLLRNLHSFRNFEQTACFQGSPTPRRPVRVRGPCPGALPDTFLAWFPHPRSSRPWEFGWCGRTRPCGAGASPPRCCTPPGTRCGLPGASTQRRWPSRRSLRRERPWPGGARAPMAGAASRTPRRQPGHGLTDGKRGAHDRRRA